MQQRLGWNAADIEADPAEGGVAFDQHHIQPQIGGAEGGGIAAGAGTEHDQAAFDIGRLAAAQRRFGRGWFGRGAMRGRHRRFCSRGRSRCGRRGSGTVGAGRCGFQHRDDGTFGHGIAEFHLQFDQRAGLGCRHFHRGLVRFQRDQPLVLAHRVADGDQQFDHRHIGKAADIRNRDVDACHGVLPQALYVVKEGRAVAARTLGAVRAAGGGCRPAGAPDSW